MRNGIYSAVILVLMSTFSVAAWAGDFAGSSMALESAQVVNGQSTSPVAVADEVVPFGPSCFTSYSSCENSMGPFCDSLGALYYCTYDSSQAFCPAFMPYAGGCAF